MANIKDGINRVYNTTRRVGAAAGRGAYNLIGTQHQAIMAGVRAQRATMYELSAKRLGTGYDRGVESARAYYQAVDNYYEQNQTRIRSIPTGPMLELARITGHKPTESELAYMKHIDERYRQGAVDIILPGGITFAGTRANIFAESYKDLSPSQILGFENTVVIRMAGEDFRTVLEMHDVDTSQMGLNSQNNVGGVASLMFESMALGGSVFVNSGPEVRESFEETLSHEMLHAGDGAVYNEARSVLMDDNASAREKQAARRAFEAADAVFSKRIDQVSPALKGLISNDYFATVSEFRAYTTEMDHGADYIDHIARDQNISREESARVVQEIARDPVIREINSIMNDYAEGILEGAANE
jgi:hypothetical protein